MSLAVAASMPRCDYVGTNHSELAHHGKCCEMAREWLLSMHRSVTFSRTDKQSVQAPIWLKTRYKWGPVKWPLSWCEAVGLEAIDCGVFAAFAREIFERVDSSRYEIFPAQIVLDQPKTLTSQWTQKWKVVPKGGQWIGDHQVYHEVCAIAVAGTDQVRIYDPTEGVWIDPVLEHGINNVIGVNVRSPRMLQWGSLRVGMDQWQML